MSADELLSLLRSQRDDLINPDLARVRAIRSALARYERALHATSIQTLRCALGLPSEEISTREEAKDLLRLVLELSELRLEALPTPSTESSPIESPAPAVDPEPETTPVVVLPASAKPVAQKPIMPRVRRERPAPTTKVEFPPRKPIHEKMIVSIREDFPKLREFFQGKKLLVAAGVEETAQRKQIERLSGATVKWVDARDGGKIVESTCESIQQGTYAAVILGVAFCSHKSIESLERAAKAASVMVTRRGKLTIFAVSSAMEYFEVKIKK